jgi:hypothetical protein
MALAWQWSIISFIIVTVFTLGPLLFYVFINDLCNVIDFPNYLDLSI